MTHGGLGGCYMCIFSHILAELLPANVNDGSTAGVDWFVEYVKVGVNLGLGDFCVVSHDVVIDVADGEPVDTLGGVLECGEHPFFERGGPDVDCDATFVYILGPVDIQYLVFGSEAFALGRICTRKYVGIQWGCIGGWL